MTGLKHKLIARIARTGPITVADYMAECLLHPEHGYYATRDPLGVAGDFTTAPEISQMFGELIGLWLAQVWLDQGAPDPFVLAELGPGRGTLMADALRAARSVPGFLYAARLHLVEASPTLRAVQASTLASHAPQFHDSIADLPEGPFLLIANEFFDALPIRQFLKAKGALWHERMIGAEGDRLIWGLAPAAPHAALSGRAATVTEGQIVETCAPAEAIAGEIGRRVASHGGAALIIDYGGWDSIGDTFQALAAHAPVDPLDSPGTADLTAHVAFGPIARAAHPARASGLTPQGVMLERLGITARAQALARNLRGAGLESHVAAHRRLTHPSEMGHLFRALALTSATAPLPLALDPGPTCP
ncbi:class I SAM-dependent methyltransferase [Roseicyclus mahoneyensis]|uniref:SAM-dependent MidA family methyltransferase n=1 Tax=Roseicyclus mahoneyensis TaxID=164332 RepID=A0A316GFR6_9RHOB|nr:SAM-dependent methyltransferase [Roseicyclus mahoneyensis]PWK59534.1 SAM-dependent MidA family methyltransferase [Roseicyclus mahoneyensis]